jgi:hypothetical protein
MTVAELKDILETYDEDLEVVLVTLNRNHYDIEVAIDDWPKDWPGVQVVGIWHGEKRD